MTRYALRYRPDSDLGRRFTATPAGHYASYEEAENVRLTMTERDQIETVEVDE